MRENLVLVRARIARSVGERITPAIYRMLGPLEVSAGEVRPNVASGRSQAGSEWNCPPMADVPRSGGDCGHEYVLVRTGRGAVAGVRPDGVDEGGSCARWSGDA